MVFIKVCKGLRKYLHAALLFIDCRPPKFSWGRYCLNPGLKYRK